MMTSTISMEQISVTNNNTLGISILGIIEQMMEFIKEDKNNVNQLDSHGDQLIKVIGDKTGILIEKVEFLPSVLNAGVMLYDPIGHNGVSGNAAGEGLYSARNTPFQDKLIKGSVDLNKAKVSGGFTEIPFQMILGTSFLDGTINANAEEVTAVILHEIGHAFWSLATIGEYVWFNYFLTEGLEILTGKKSNTYNVELLDIGYLIKHVSDDALRTKLREQPTDGELRKAIIDVKHNYARGQYHSISNVGSRKRHEQMADWFVARMGFAKPLVTCLVKLQRSSSLMNSIFMNNGTFAAKEVLKYLFGVAILRGSLIILPGLTGVLMMLFLAADLSMVSIRNGAVDYDSPVARLKKIRMDLVAQVRQLPRGHKLIQKTMQDIDEIDALLKGMKDRQGPMAGLLYVLNADYRRDRQVIEQEQQFEELLNNGLHLSAQRFNR